MLLNFSLFESSWLSPVWLTQVMPIECFHEMYFIDCHCHCLIHQGIWENMYPKFPKYSDTQKFVVITLKFEICGFTTE